MISSQTNPRVKQVRRLQGDKRYRIRQNAYIVEGTRWLKALLENGRNPQQIFYTAAWASDTANERLLTQFQVDQQLVSPQVMQALSDTESPSGILAVVEMTPISLPKTLSNVLILDGIADPGNVGTLLRTASAVGVDGVMLAPNCVDAFNPKVVRSGMGAQIQLPLAVLDWKEIELAVKGLAVRLATADGASLYTAVDWKRPTALIIGSEAHGAGVEARRLAQEIVYIPIRERVESLNAGVAGAVIMYEILRQRMSGGDRFIG